MNSRLSPALARSLQGQVFYCTCKKLVTMRFKGRWFAFEDGGLADFRDALFRLLNDPALIQRLVREAWDEAISRGGCPERLPSVEDLGEMLNLVETALLVLAAQEIVEKA